MYTRYNENILCPVDILHEYPNQLFKRYFEGQFEILVKEKKIVYTHSYVFFNQRGIACGENVSLRSISAMAKS